MPGYKIPPSGEKDSWSDIRASKKPFFPKKTGSVIKLAYVGFAWLGFTSGEMFNQIPKATQPTTADVVGVALLSAFCAILANWFIMGRMKFHTCTRTKKCGCAWEDIEYTSWTNILFPLAYAIAAFAFASKVFGDAASGVFAGMVTLLAGSISASAASWLIPLLIKKVFRE